MEGLKFVMKDCNPEDPTTQLDTNDLTPDHVNVLHKVRKDLQRGIQLGDLDLVKKAGRRVTQILGGDGGDELNILKRVPDNKVRAYKNILLSFNTLYSCEAENGGLSPWHTHTLSEKYAVLIEHSENLRVMFQGISEGNELNILKRVPGNKVRALKNILLSFNTLYSIEAEKGGLSPLQCHLMSEKYAVMIEHAENISQLEEIHSKMLNEYADPTIRITKSENLSIVEQAENYIEMHFAEDISTEEMAEKLHVHPSHLMRVFKKEKGITISKYRNLKRTQKAKDLILSSNLSMTDIAIMVGFKHPQYFSTLFKEVEGLTPVEFKKRNKNK